MQQKFNQIKAEYDRFYRILLKQGRLPLWDTEIGFWNAAAADDLFETFKKCHLHKHKHFLDLGSGDGKAVLIASLFGVNATGIEFDTDLTKKAEEIRKKLRINHANFVNDDFNWYNLSKYDVIFANPDKPMHRGLEQKLKREMTGRLIVHGHHFQPTNLKQIGKFIINNNLVGVYEN